MKLWVYELQVSEMGTKHEVLVEKDASELPDGVGFESRAAAKQHRQRSSNARPIWSDYEMESGHIERFRKILRSSGFVVEPEPFSSFKSLAKFVKRNFFRRRY